jgi:hypothetical protein
LAFLNEATTLDTNFRDKAIIVYRSSLGLERPLPTNYPNIDIIKL